jgi:RNA polymerase sigma-70 factor, ECF subfamily
MNDPTLQFVQPQVNPFEPLLGACLEQAFGMALRMTGNRQDAEDLVQEAALRAFRSFAGFTQGTNFKAWFFRIMINQLRTQQRSRRSHTSLDDFEEVHPLYLYERAADAGLRRSGPDPAAELLERLSGDDIARALARLAEPFRTVATLYFMDDLTYQDIAEVLDTPVGTVRSRLHRARAMLQRELWQVAEDLGVVPGGTSRERMKEE